jgi:hypothetical protein
VVLRVVRHVVAMLKSRLLQGVDSKFLGDFESFESSFSYPTCPKPIFLESELNREVFNR